MFSPPCEQGGHWPPLLGYPRLASGAVVFAGRCVGLRLAQPLEVVAALQALGVVLAELDPCLVVALDGLLPLVAGDLVGVQIVALEPADRRAMGYCAQFTDKFHENYFSYIIHIDSGLESNVSAYHRRSVPSSHAFASTLQLHKSASRCISDSS